MTEVQFLIKEMHDAKVKSVQDFNCLQYSTLKKTKSSDKELKLPDKNTLY